MGADQSWRIPCSPTSGPDPGTSRGHLFIDDDICILETGYAALLSCLPGGSMQPTLASLEGGSSGRARISHLA